MKSLTLTKDNYLDFLDPKLSTFIRGSKSIGDYFLQRLKKFCSIIPEFTYQPILFYKDGWCYDSKHYWKDDVGRCSLRLHNSYFGFNDKVNKWKRICIDWKSFGIKQVGEKKVSRLCGVPIDYLTPVEEKEQLMNRLKMERAELIAELKTLEED